MPELSVAAEPRFDLEIQPDDWKYQKQARSDKLHAYLLDAARANGGDTSIVEVAWEVWQALNHSAGGGLPVPDASIGPDNQVFYTWDSGEHHFEAEILTEGMIEFFYRNRTTGRFWALDQRTTDPVSDNVKTKLTLFANL